MSAKAKGPPKNQSWIWLTRDLLSSPAWCDMGINERRLIDFLLLEHMGAKGCRNGQLVAPWRQLEEFGIAHRYIAETIANVEKSGLVDCVRGVGRAPNRYALTWLPMCDGSEPSNRWAIVVGNKGNP